MNDTDIRIIGQTIGFETALDVLAGYAFETIDRPWMATNGAAFGHAPTIQRYRWAYRSYDCVTPSPGLLEPADLLIAAGLNGEMNAGRMQSFLSIVPELDEALAKIPASTCFWELRATEITHPQRDTPAWWMQRAWWLCIGCPDIGLTITHKLLHHKRPAVFPLIDSTTKAVVRDASGAGSMWSAIHRDLTTTPAQFGDLERKFEQLALVRGGVPITRLRMHDILLWCQANKQFDDARVAGARIRESRLWCETRNV